MRAPPAHHLLPALTSPPHPRVQAAMSQADIDAFVADQPPASATLPSLAEAGDLQTIKLFSLNDYLGLSTHPAVRQAAADAALQCGNGEAACCGELRGEAATVCQSACGQICFALLMLYPRSKPLPNQVRPCLVRPAPPRRPPLLSAGGRLHQLAPRPGGRPGPAEGHRRLPAVPHRLCRQPGGCIRALPGRQCGGAFR